MATAATDVAALRLDAQELTSLAGAAKRPANQARLNAAIEQVQAQIAAAEAAEAAAAAPNQEAAAAVATTTAAAAAESPAPAGAGASPAASAAGAGGDAAPAPPAAAAAAPPALPAGAEYIPIQTFGWDQSNKFVSVYVSESMAGVKAAGAKVDCDFTGDSFDLTVQGLNGKSYRLTRKGLDKDIDPAKSKVKVKDDRVVLMLKKVPGEFGPDHWTDLVPKRKRPKTSTADPTAGIMDLMKDMYDNGDDQMKKTIGEAMLKSQQDRAGGGGGFDM